MSPCHFVPIKLNIWYTCNCVTFVWKKNKTMVLNKSEFFLMQHRSTHAASLAFACSCRYVAPGLNQSDGLPGHPSNFFSDREPQTGSLFAYWLVIHTAIWLAPSNFREGNFTNHDNTYAYMHLSSTSCSHDVDFVLILHVPPNILSFFPFLL